MWPSIAALTACSSIPPSRQEQSSICSIAAPVSKPRKSKVKTACRTCKIRKIKCDEKRPACQRCLSTGRKCDGYGVWDTPGNRQTPNLHAHVKVEPATLQLNFFSPHVTTCSTQDRQCLDWFLCRTVTKLPGTFRSFFWDKLLLQASISEHAVLHAVLALGSVSKDGAFVIADLGRGGEVVSKEEHNTTQHYLQSLSQLEKCFSSQEQRSIRIILISCIAFVCLDFLWGHFESGQSHLRSCLRVSEQSYHAYQIPSEYGSNDDEWILEIFARLDLMVKLFRPPSIAGLSRIQIDPRMRNIAAPTSYNLKEAWKDLQRLLNQALDLNAHPAPRTRKQRLEPSQAFQVLLKHQQQVDADLEQWQQTYHKYVDIGNANALEEMQKVHHILYAYHHMALIMTRTALSSRSEIAFDDHTHLFLLIVLRMCKLRKITPAHYEGLGEAGLKNLHEYLSDIGWITPLYFTASRCRHHRLRLQAVRLLESSFHREGIWDSITTACVARKIMEIEEQDFYSESAVCEDFKLTDLPLAMDLTLPTIPEAYRIQDVEVVLSGAPMDEIRLFSHRVERYITVRAPLSTYNVHSQRWTDAGEWWGEEEGSLKLIETAL